MKKALFTTLWIIFFLITLVSFTILVYGYEWYQEYTAVQQEHADELAAQEAAIEGVLSNRLAGQLNEGGDPFGDDDVVRVLMIGLDSRAGQEHGHCDAIQMIEVNRAEEHVTITAVPRGTYAPLPPGTGVTSTDYYVSNSCALGGLEYGITNIERILGNQADYLVVIGFSETLGILRRVELPTTETLQWLRQRQGYAIGEPQRARNHSTFIKQMVLRFIPDETSAFDKPFHYILYKIINTDLSFGEAEALIDALTKMDLKNNPDRIRLAMKPAYSVQDIPYDPELLDEQLDATVGRVSKWLSPKDYSGKTEEEIQAVLLESIETNTGDESFDRWAFENDLWLQVADQDLRHQIRWDMMLAYMPFLSREEIQELLADYILEMQHLEYEDWEEKGRELLLKEIEKGKGESSAE